MPTHSFNAVASPGCSVSKRSQRIQKIKPFPISRVALSRILFGGKQGNHAVGNRESASINFPSLGSSTFNTPAKGKEHQNVNQNCSTAVQLFFLR
jgi:hypothetical protein